jgi:hypothetical protein
VTVAWIDFVIARRCWALIVARVWTVTFDPRLVLARMVRAARNGARDYQWPERVAPLAPHPHI